MAVDPTSLLATGYGMGHSFYLQVILLMQVHYHVFPLHFDLHLFMEHFHEQLDLLYELDQREALLKQESHELMKLEGIYHHGALTVTPDSFLILNIILT